MAFKINISEKSGKTFHLESDSEELIGKELHDKISGKEILGDLEGYEFEITGTSDKAGFTSLKEVEGIGLTRVLLSYEKAMKKRPKKEPAFLMCYQAGMCGTGPKMIILKKLFEKLGIVIGGGSIGKRGVRTYKINLASLSDSDVCFSIHRKFFKFCEYVNQVKSSTTIRRTLEYTSDDIV